MDLLQIACSTRIRDKIYGPEVFGDQNDPKIVFLRGQKIQNFAYFSVFDPMKNFKSNFLQWSHRARSIWS
jgi:hypothetical protein